MATKDFDPSGGKDLGIREPYPSNNYALYQSFVNVLYAGGVKIDWWRNLIEFDLSGMPAHLSLDAAKLTLGVTTAYAASASKVHRCVRAGDWVLNQATWSQFKTGSPWTTAGCGHDGDDYDSATPTPVPFTTPPGTGPFDITGMLGMVNYAIDHVADILSLRLRLDDEAPGHSAGIVWDSSVLTVTYTPLVAAPYIKPVKLLQP